MVSIDQIKSLRERTGVSMQVCKKALEETAGDETKAVEMLRKRGEMKAAERADRSAGEGVIAVAQSDGKAVLLKLGCETDFSARNEEFVALAQKIADGVLAGRKTTDFSPEVADMGSKIGEKVEVDEPVVFEGSHLGVYLHGTRKLAAVVSLSAGGNELARDIAMHVAASAPMTITPENIDVALIEKEKEFWKEELAKQGKPEDIRENIMKGKEKKFREERALLTQPFVKNPDATVGQHIEKEAPGAVVTEFMRLAV